MATNALIAYLNEGFDYDFVTDLIEYIKNKPGTKEVVRTRDSIKIERKNHFSMCAGTFCRIDPNPNVTVNEYGDWLCDMVDDIM